ncbi:MAG: hypothetical protein M3162_07450 [Thermoproteota archaeon]|nr:hypothetical protein [Thermoproteota archaeon]
MEILLKNTLKRQVPYLIGGTITGIIMSYYYGFLFSIIVNSIAWFAISTIVNKYYWNYTGFGDEKRLLSKYIINRKGNKNKGKRNISQSSGGLDNKTSEIKSETGIISENIKDSNIKGIGSPLK